MIHMNTGHVEQPEDPLTAYTRWSLRRRLNKKKTSCLIQAMLKKYTTFVKDIFNKAHNEGPITRAKAKLIKYKDAAQRHYYY